MRQAPWRKIATAVGLLLALTFVFAVQFTPHLSTFNDEPTSDGPGLVQLGDAWFEYATGERDGFPYAIHVDEHFHMASIAKLQRTDTLHTGDPYTESTQSVDAFTSLRGAVHERGYHILLAQFQDLTGISTKALYQFGPALWMTFIAFGVYALLRPHPAAVPAAAFVGLVPTTVRFLGPGFLVPIGFSLAWLPAAAILTEPAKRKAAAAGLLLGVSAWAFFVHLIAGFACVALMLGAAVFSSGRERRSALILFVLGLLPVAWLWRSFSGGVQSEIAREQFLPIDFTIFDHFGYITLFLWMGGVALYWLDPPEEEAQRPAAAAFASLSLVSLALIVSSVAFDLNRYATYTRIHPIFFLTAALPVGYGIATVARRGGERVRKGLSWLSKRWPRLDDVAAPSGTLVAVVVALALIVPATSQAVSFHLEEPYYQVMTDPAWNAYEAVDANLSEEGSPYEVFLGHPWQAPFLVEKTGKHPHTVMRPGGPPAQGDSFLRYERGGASASMFVMNDITLVIGSRAPPGEFWEQHSAYVYVMEEPYAEQIQRLRNGQSLQLDQVPEEPIPGVGEAGNASVAPGEDPSSYTR